MSKPQGQFRGVLKTIVDDDVGSVHFLGTKDGHHWRLEVDADRVRHFNGLEVEVKGELRKGAVRVSSVVQV
jgi:hypothetical protein